MSYFVNDNGSLAPINVSTFQTACYNQIMKKVKKLVVGNWKMNPTSLAEAKKLAADVKKGSKSSSKTQIVICPPVIFSPRMQNIPSVSLCLGAQDAFYETSGPHTGEISVSQMSEFKISHVVVGHSERRKMGESDEIINKKVKAVVGEGMTAIVCVGENERDNDGKYLEIIRNQIVLALNDVNRKLLDHVVVAYEPVWLIGGRKAMAPQDAQETVLYVRRVLREMFGALSGSIRIIYGASVAPDSAGLIVHGGFIQGLLVGRDSLDAKKFLEIIKAVDRG